jgi:glycosyltransferase involved in cell wall biosynthesis
MPVRPVAERPRVAIVSDPIVQRGGAERVVEAFADAFPEAPVFAILYSLQNGPAALRSRVRESWLGRVPGAARRHRYFLPFYAKAVESFDLSEYDVILSSHHTAAKGLLRGAAQVHVCYCHTPMRALWERTHQELSALPAVARPAAAAMLDRLRMWDYVTAARVDRFVANSRLTQLRIRKHYGRDSELLYPPIETERFTPGGEAGDYYLVASRAVPYKRIDVAVEATARAGRRLVLVGDRHRIGAAPHVTTLGHVSNDRLVELMRGARALLFPQHEDFGMTALEMNACGRPVIAYGSGGAVETVVDGYTGVLVPEQTPEAFARGIERFESLRFDPLTLRLHAESFSRERFVAALRELIARAWREAHEARSLKRSVSLQRRPNVELRPDLVDDGVGELRRRGVSAEVARG